MRIQFSPCGIGLGHVGRCIPIARRLKKNGAQVLFSTYKEGIQYLQHEGLPVVEAPEIEFMVKPDGTVDFRRSVTSIGPLFASFTLLKQVEAEIQTMQAYKPDVVVSDSRISPLIAAKLLGIPDICILNQFQIIIPRRKRLLRLAKLADAGALAVIGMIWSTARRLLIPDFPPPYTISRGNLRIPRSYRNNLQLIGPILPVHPHDIPSRRRIRRKLGLHEDKVLIFAPVSGPTKERAYFTGLLRQIFKEISDEYQIVMSLGYPNTSTHPIHNGNLTIYRWMPNRFEHLKACDLVIARAGHGTLTQSICYGRPLILVPTPSHTEQLNNAKRAVQLEIAELIEQKDLSKETLLESLQRTVGDGEFQERAEQIQRAIMKLNGVEAAVQTIEEAMEHRS